MCVERLAEFVADLIVENERLRVDNKRLRWFGDVYRQAVLAGSGANA